MCALRWLAFVSAQIQSVADCSKAARNRFLSKHPKNCEKMENFKVEGRTKLTKARNETTLRLSVSFDAKLGGSIKTNMVNVLHVFVALDGGLSTI